LARQADLPLDADAKQSRSCRYSQAASPPDDYRQDRQFRWRLVGTAAVREIGRDPTGSIVGSYITGSGSAAAVRAIYGRVFTTARPVFATSKFHFTSGAIQSLSYLLLPLSDDGTQVNMIVSTLLARFDFDAEASFNWLKGLPIKVCDMINVCDAADLEKLCLEWDRRSLNRATRPSAGNGGQPLRMSSSSTSGQ